MKLPDRGSATILCPACARPFDLPLRITSEPHRGGATIYVGVDDSFMETFGQHVLADPDAHPDFMLAGDEHDDAKAAR